MNTIYKLVWNASQRVWVVAGEFSKSKKKSSKSGLVSSVIVTSLTLCTFSSLAEMSGTQEKILNDEGIILTQPSDLNAKGTEIQGKDAWHLSGIGNISYNQAIIDLGTVIHGGHGIHGGTGISGHNVSIINESIIEGGGDEGYPHGDTGGTAIRGYNLAIINYDYISGGYSNTGGYGIKGGKLRIENEGTIVGGEGRQSGGAGITGVDMKIRNSGQISGWDATTDKGGTAIYSMNSSITNSGIIWGGMGNLRGGTGILSGSDLQAFSTNIENSGRISGGYSSNTGGAAISSQHNDKGTIFIANSGEIAGGYGTYRGGDAISGHNMTIINTGNITGGYGSLGGGTGIWGYNMNIVNNGVIAGGLNAHEDVSTAIYVTKGKNYLTLNPGSVISGELYKAPAAFLSVVVNDGATFNLSGQSQSVTNISNSGTVLINGIGADQLLNTPITFTGDMYLEKTGRVVINNNASNVGQTWIQNGNWTGHGGTVYLGTVLGDDNSKTDHLEITGHASGTTYVAVTNVNGIGAPTMEGIKLISTGSSDKDAFVQKGRIVAGMYDYYLQQGSATGKDMNSWYLTREFEPVHRFV